MQITRTLVGRGLMSAVAVFGAVGGFRADWNETHVKNPRWPPHAKFHNAQTLATGVLLGASTLFFTWRQSGDRKTNDLAAILFGGGYFWTQIAAGFFPGTAWKDPEFLQPGESLDEPFSPQDRMGLAATALVLLAGALMWPGKTAKVSASVDR